MGGLRDYLTHQPGDDDRHNQEVHMDIQHVQQLNEDYLRADQEWRDAVIEATVKHRGEGSEMIVHALAAQDTTDLRKQRLETLIAWENAHLEFTAALRRPEYLEAH